MSATPAVMSIGRTLDIKNYKLFTRNTEVRSPCIMQKEVCLCCIKQGAASTNLLIKAFFVLTPLHLWYYSSIALQRLYAEIKVFFLFMGILSLYGYFTYSNVRKICLFSRISVETS